MVTKRDPLDEDEFEDTFLKFGHTFEGSYNRHGIMGIIDVFWNPHLV